MKRARLLRFGLGVLGLLVLVSGLLAGAALADDRAAASAAKVRLVVDYGDGLEKHFTGLRWTTGMTVFDALGLAKEHPHGITFEHKDYGEQVGYLITRIDDLENQGGGGAAKNWIYSVNDKQAKTACNKYGLEAGDAVRWTFEQWR